MIKQHQRWVRFVRGFTLVELLLAVVLVLGMLGAVVYNFSSFQRSARLDEGAVQVEALFRFARAHAASTGRQVRVEFRPQAGLSAHELRARWGNRRVFECFGSPTPLRLLVCFKNSRRRPILWRASRIQ
jgi:Tfp pilus assembly protein FimT